MQKCVNCFPSHANWQYFYYYLHVIILGIYSEIITGPTFNITQQIYVHRRLSSLIVVEVDLERSEVNEPLKLNTDLNRWTTSYDLTFLKPDYDKEEVR